MGNLLLEYRKRIDDIDKQILSLLKDRMEVVKLVGQYKKQNNIPPLDAERWSSVLQSVIDSGTAHGLSAELVKNIYESIHEEALRIEQ